MEGGAVFPRTKEREPYRRLGISPEVGHRYHIPCVKCAILSPWIESPEES